MDVQHWEAVPKEFVDAKESFSKLLIFYPVSIDSVEVVSKIAELIIRA